MFVFKHPEAICFGCACCREFFCGSRRVCDQEPEGGSGSADCCLTCAALSIDLEDSARSLAKERNLRRMYQSKSMALEAGWGLAQRLAQKKRLHESEDIGDMYTTNNGSAGDMFGQLL